MAKRIPVSHMLKEACKLKSREERVQYLRDNFHPVIGEVLRWTFDPNLKWALPAGAPPYRACTYPDADFNFYSEVRKIPRLFFEGGHPTLNQRKRELIFIEVLESIHADDARLLLHIKDKRMPRDMRPITVALVREALPGLLPENAKDPKAEKESAEA